MNKKKNFVLWILLTNVLIAFLGNGLAIPVMPAYMKQLGISGTTVGYLVATYAVCQFIISPFAGKWVDQFGRKKFILIGLALFSVSEVLFGIGQSTTILFISRMLGGISAGLIMPAITAFIADVTTLQQRSKAIGYMAAAINLGYIIGPGVGGMLASISIRAPFFVAAIFAFCALIVSLILLKEPVREMSCHQLRDEAIKEKYTNTSLKKVFTVPYQAPLFIILVVSVAVATFHAIISLYLDEKFTFSPMEIAVVMIGSGVLGMVAQLLLFDGLVKTIGEIKLIRYALILSVLLIFSMTIIQGYWLILTMTIILYIGTDMVRPAVSTFLSKMAGPSEQGFAGGMNSMFTSIGNVIGPIIGGTLFDWQIDLPFYVATVIMMVAVLMAYLWKKPKEYIS